MGSNKHNYFLPTYFVITDGSVNGLATLEKLKNKPELEITVINEKVLESNGLVSWHSLIRVIENAQINCNEIILIALEGDKDVDNFNFEILFENISFAYKAGIDVILIGATGYREGARLNEAMAKIESYDQSSLIIILNTAFGSIMKADISSTVPLNSGLSCVIENMAIVYPETLDVLSKPREDIRGQKNELRYLENANTVSKYHHNTTEHRDKDAEEIVPYIMEMFRPKSVVDIGCGLGNFLEVFKKYGASEILGLDGKWVDLNKMKIDLSCFRSVNLEEPINFVRKFDLAVCLEVAEHIEEKFSENLIETLTSASDIILFSAAVPYQGGQNHVNEQWIEYWIDKFKRKQFTFYDLLRKHFWNNTSIFWWYRQNMFIVINDSVNHNFPKEEIQNYIHPEHYLNKIL